MDPNRKPSAPPPNYPSAYPQAQYPGYPPGAGMPAGPPPPYSAMPYGAAAAPPYNIPPTGGPPPQYGGYMPQQVPQGTVHMPTAFDAGARFDKNARPNIPPPPPGVMPNPAQIAMMQGQNVVAGQKESTFMSGTGGGGYTFW